MVGKKNIFLGGENPINKLQPGDLYLRTNNVNSGHITVIVEVDKRNGRIKTYDCGNSSHWTKHPNGDPYDATWFLKDSRLGKIIRVK